MDDGSESENDDKNSSDLDNQLNNESTPKRGAKMSSDNLTDGIKSSTLFTSSVNDPILLTHAKCMNEDILSAWKRLDTKMKLKKSFSTNNFNDSNDNNNNHNMEVNESESESSSESEITGKLFKKKFLNTKKLGELRFS